MTRSLRRRLESLVPPTGPWRTLAVAAIANTMGKGAFVTAGLLFLVTVRDMSPTTVGLAFTLGGLTGLLAGVPLGYLADRRDPRALLVATSLVDGLAVAAFVFVDSFTSLLLLTCAIAVADRGSEAIRNGVIAQLGGGADRIRMRTYMRALTSAGVAVGGLAAGIAVTQGSFAAYATVFFLDAASLAIAAVLYLRLPRIVRHGHGSPRFVVLRDRGFLAVTALGALLTVRYGVVSIAVPLWIVLQTDAPRQMVGVLLVVHTIGVVALQVRAGRGTERVDSAALTCRRAAILVATSCLIFAGTAVTGSWTTIVVLLIATVIFVGGEVLQVAGSWGLAFGLAPEHLHGQYQGMTSTGFALSTVLAPIIMTGVASAGGLWGWAALAAGFVVVGFAVPPVARWARREQSLRPAASI